MLTRGTENRYGELHQPGYEHSFGRTAPLPPTFAPRHFQRSVRSQRGRKSNSVLSDAATRPSPAPPPPPRAEVPLRSHPGLRAALSSRPRASTARRPLPTGGRAGSHSAIVGGLGEGQGGDGDSRTRPLRGRGSKPRPHGRAARRGAGRAPPARAERTRAGRRRETGGRARERGTGRPYRSEEAAAAGDAGLVAPRAGPRLTRYATRRQPGSYLRRGQPLSSFGCPRPGDGSESSGLRRWLR